MKKIIFFCLAITFSIALNAQNFESFFGTESTTIKITGSIISSSHVDNWEEPLRYDDTIDTLGLTFIAGLSFEYFAESENHDVLLRLLGSKTFTLDTLVNMNLKIGDSISLNEHPACFVYGSYQEFPSIAKVVAKYQMNNKWVIEFDAIINIDDSLQVPLRFIEGVGPNYSWVFNYPINKGKTASIVTCFYKDGVQTYQEPALDSCGYKGAYQYVSVQNTTRKNKGIENLNIEGKRLTCTLSSQSDYQMNVYNLQGQPIVQNTIKSASTISCEVTGNTAMYIVSVLNLVSNERYNQKILMQ